MSRPKPLPTYQEIAKKAGVSIKTVCNVFRYPELVREKTTARVLKSLKQMGISDPSVMKKKLRPARVSHSSSLLFLESTSSGAITTPIYSKIVVAAEARAHEMGWQLSVRHRNAEEDLTQALRNFRGEGVLLFSKKISYNELSVALPGVAAVRVLGAPDTGHDCDNVDYDRAEVPRLAARYLAEKGCKRVAYIGTFLDVRGPNFLKHVKEIGLEGCDSRDNNLISREVGAQIINRAVLVRLWEKVADFEPNGIFVESDQITSALYGVLDSFGLKPQRDLQIVSCNAEELFLSPLHPRPATIDIHPAEIGRRAVELLIARIGNKESPPSRLVIQPKLLAVS